MSEKKGLNNAEIAALFDKYARFKYKPLGVYFSDVLPSWIGKKRFGTNLFNRCLPRMAFFAAAKGKSSIVAEGYGCPGGLWWAGFSKYPPRGLTVFLSTGGRWDCFGGRGEHLKKNPARGAHVIKFPGPVKQPAGTKYIVFQRLKEIPDRQIIEFVLFFVKPDDMAKMINLLHFNRDENLFIRSPGGSGCQAILNFPLLMKQEPEPDAVMGFWDPVARRHLPKNLLSIAVRRWLVEYIARDIHETFLAYPPPFTLKFELPFLFKRLKRKLRERKEKADGSRTAPDISG
nr:DUF169 domain-containing protein [Candidatus Sigynarchaeum springense]